MVNTSRCVALYAVTPPSHRHPQTTASARESLLVSELRPELKRLGLKNSGRRDELIKRLDQYHIDNGGTILGTFQSAKKMINTLCLSRRCSSLLPGIEASVAFVWEKREYYRTVPSSLKKGESALSTGQRRR